MHENIESLHVEAVGLLEFFGGLGFVGPFSVLGDLLAVG